MKSENIKFGMLQYGMWGDEFLSLFGSKKGQMVAVVDFAALPEEGVSPDFWSDHHHTKEEMKNVFNAAKSGGGIGKSEFRSDTEHLATSHAQGLADYTTIKPITNIDSAKYARLLDTFELPTNFKEKGRMERLAILINSLISELIKRNPTATYELIKKTKPSLVNLFVNLKNMVKLSNIQQAGIDEIGKDNPDWSMIDKIRNKLPMSMAKEVSKTGEKKSDTFGKEKYADELVKQLQSELFKPKPNWERIKKIAEEMPKRIKSRLSLLLKEIRPKMIELRAKISDDYEFKKKTEPFMTKIRNLLSEDINEAEEGDEEKKYIPNRSIGDLEFWRKKHKEDLERVTTAGEKRSEVANKVVEKFKEELKALGRKKAKEELEVTEKREKLRRDIERLGKWAKKIEPTITAHNKVAKVDQATGFHPSRFTAAVITDKDGNRFPIMLRKFTNMLQVSLNPDVAKNDKINLIDDLRSVFTSMRKKYANQWNDWAWKEIDKELGGHAAIANLPSLSLISIGFMKKADREKLKELELIKKRLSAIKKGRSFSTLMPGTKRLYDELAKKKETSKEEKDKIIAELIDELIKLLNSKYPDLKVTKPIDKPYKLAEEIIYRSIS